MTLYSTITLSSIIAAFTITSLAAPINNQRIEFGIYSRNNKDYKLDNFKTHHYFSTWHPNEDQINKEIINKFNNNPQKNSLITLEPWPVYNEKYDRIRFMANIVEGKYRPQIQKFCTLVEQKSKANISIRWGHEMDLFGSSHYPWVVANPQLFVNAYRKWVDTCNEFTTKINYIWSPEGGKDNTRFYPGDKYVDYVGLSWYSYPAFEWYRYKKILDFDEHMSWKYNTTKGYNKPIILAEFGMTETNKTTIISSLSNPSDIKRKFPLLHSIVIFSDSTASWIPGVIAAPDWRVNQNVLNKFK
ncbi:MAG: glycosyl hydrolase [Patescibacteria group bacterium]